MRRRPLELPSQQWYRRGKLWVAPATGAGIAFVVGIVVLALDTSVISSTTALPPKYVGTVETARVLLSVTATTIATLTALVLTIVTVVLQLASDKYSHRSLRTFLQDRHSHVTLATFVGTFTFAVLALLGIDSTIERQSGDVVGLTIPTAFVLAVFSLGIFVSYIDHIVHAARGTSIIERIGGDTRAEIDRLYPAPSDQPPREADHELPEDPDAVIPAPRPGVVYELNVDGLIDWAAQADATLIIRPAIGDFIPGGAPLVEVHGDGDDHDEVALFVHLDPERTITDDVGFGFRLLVDIAENALSPGVNDPTTAVQCIDQLHDLLRRLVTRHISNGWHADADGTRRLYVPPTGWDDFVELACDEIRLYGEGHLSVARRLRAMLFDLRATACEERRPALDRQLKLLAAANERAFAHEEDHATADTADAQGIGGGTASRTQ